MGRGEPGATVTPAAVYFGELRVGEVVGLDRRTRAARRGAAVHGIYVTPTAVQFAASLQLTLENDPDPPSALGTGTSTGVPHAPSVSVAANGWPL